MIMKVPVLLLLQLLGIGVATAEDAKVTPVEKVLELMYGMLLKGMKEKKDEQVQYAAFKQFCDDTTAEKSHAIGGANLRIEVLAADIGQYTANAKRLTNEIAQHDTDISWWTGDIKAATKVRSMEQADYDELHQDYSESIDALQRAVAVLKKQAHDRPQAEEEAPKAPPTEAPPTSTELLLQRDLDRLQSLSLMPDSAKKVIASFLQRDPDEADDVGLGVSAPEANAYEFQSHGVIQMLEKLLDKFIAERSELEKEEMSAQHAYEMMVQNLQAEIDHATQERTQQSTARDQMLEAEATAEGELADTTATRNSDAKYLKDLNATCEEKAADFESRQLLRGEELLALQKAVDIIRSETVAGSAEQHLPTLLQTAQPASFAQLRAESSSQAAVAQSKVALFLRARATKLGSRVLQSVAARVAEDPFKKVKKMIKDLLVRLMEEASDEAEHKGWCDTELSTNEQVRKEKTAAVESLHAEIDELEASISKLTEEIAELTRAVAELDGAMVNATELRVEEQARNNETIADAQAAQTAVAAAIEILKDFYSKAANSTALLQEPDQPEAPEIFDSPYKGMQAEKGGVVGMLEVIQSDFARLEADTKAAEASAQKEYDEFMTDSKVDKAQKTTDIEHKGAEKQNDRQTLQEKKGDLEGTQKELDAALAYFDKLKPSCVVSGVSYEDRVQRRKEEIESLQEALRILNGEDLSGTV